jgi:hypothetical protein
LILDYYCSKILINTGQAPLHTFHSFLFLIARRSSFLLQLSVRVEPGEGIRGVFSVSTPDEREKKMFVDVKNCRAICPHCFQILVEKGEEFPSYEGMTAEQWNRVTRARFAPSQLMPRYMAEQLGIRGNLEELKQQFLRCPWFLQHLECRSCGGIYVPDGDHWRLLCSPLSSMTKEGIVPFGNRDELVEAQRVVMDDLASQACRGTDEGYPIATPE